MACSRTALLPLAPPQAVLSCTSRHRQAPAVALLLLLLLLLLLTGCALCMPQHARISKGAPAAEWGGVSACHRLYWQCLSGQGLRAPRAGSRQRAPGDCGQAARRCSCSCICATICADAAGGAQATIALIPDGTVAIELDIASVLLQWPFLSDVSLGLAAASIFQVAPPAKGDVPDPAQAEAVQVRLSVECPHERQCASTFPTVTQVLSASGVCAGKPDPRSGSCT